MTGTERGELAPSSWASRKLGTGSDCPSSLKPSRMSEKALTAVIEGAPVWGISIRAAADLVQLRCLLSPADCARQSTKAERGTRFRAPNSTARSVRLGVGLVWLARFSLTISGLWSPRFCRHTRLARRAGVPVWTVGRPDGHPVCSALGIPWEMLPAEMKCGCGMSCWRRLRDWQAAGVWRRLHQVLLERLHAVGEIDGSRASVDSASVPAKKGGLPPARTRRIGSRRAPSATSSPTHAARPRCDQRQLPRQPADGPDAGRHPALAQRAAGTTAPAPRQAARRQGL